MCLKSVLVISTLMGSLTSFAQKDKSLVISDLDDTIKLSHVLDKSETIRNLVRIDNVFVGMPDVYSKLIGLTNQKPVFYLSNAPVNIAFRWHSRFLRLHQFPIGKLILRENVLNDQHKVVAIRSILTEQKSSHVILIGDNGEKDISIYNQIVQKFPDIKFSTYIHTLYYTQGNEDKGMSLLPGQRAFATSIDLAYSLHQDGWLSADALQDVVTKNLKTLFVEDITGENGRMFFPEWFDCRDWTWDNAWDKVQIPFNRSLEFRQMKDYIIKRCQLPGEDS